VRESGFYILIGGKGFAKSFHFTLVAQLDQNENHKKHAYLRLYGVELSAGFPCCEMGRTLRHASMRFVLDSR
jgi:hypothetical protein